MKFLIDNNLAPPLARSLNELSRPAHEVVHVRAKFRHDTPDVEWLAALGNEGGWAVITQDIRLRRNKHELEAIRSAGLTVFCLAPAWTHRPFWEKAWRLVRRWPEIVGQATRVEPGLWYVVPIRYRCLRVAG